MPPKKGGQSNKSVQKAQKKIVDDKTFGLKNKGKSKKVQQYAQRVEAQVKQVGKSRKQLQEEEKRKAEREMIKASKEKYVDEMAGLFKQVTSAQTVPQGVDPKSVLCSFFKAGFCKRGDKCKFSHNLDQGRKSNKIDLYSDPRALEEAKKDESMDGWDQAKLEQVVASKDEGRVTNETQIVCKYFLDAIENSKYGWFWKCPNEAEGGKCMYKHRLPPGFVFKPKKAKTMDDQEDLEDVSQALCDEIEEERKKLDLSKCTPVTLETFTKWKQDREKKRLAEIEEKRKEAEKKTGGKGYSALSGRALFQYDPSLFVDDDAAAGGADYEAEEKTEEELRQEEEEARKEADRIEQEKYAREAKELEPDGDDDGENKDNADAPQDQGEEDGEKQADEEEPAAGAAAAAAAAGVDASLFTGDDELPED